MAAWAQASLPLLVDCECPNQPDYQAWLARRRRDLDHLRASLCRTICADHALSPAEQSRWASRWLDAAPFDPAAVRRATDIRRQIEPGAQADAFAAAQVRRFADAGLPSPYVEADIAAPGTPEAPSHRPGAANGPAPQQEIKFLQTDDNVTIGWASVGDPAAPPLVKAANWLNHLELDWEAPIWSPLFRELSQSHRFIRYDERGCGLSDCEVAEISFDSFVTDLERVVEAAGLERFPLLGISQGAAVSIEYAARHPERVSHLILFSAYDRGWRHIAKPDEVRKREAVMVLTETGWGSDNPAYRHMFSRTFMPDATAEELAWFDEFQRQ